MKAPIIATALFWCSLPQFLLAGEPSPEIRLFTGNKQLELRESARPQIGMQIVALLKSANFNSKSDRYRIFSAIGIQQDYRDAVSSGGYIVMLFSPAQKFKTASGEVTATEIVVGLNGPDGKNSVFTIDESGAITSYAKYSGTVFLELRKSIADAKK